MPEPETERRMPKIAEVESAEVKMPEFGETIDAGVVKLGMTTASEIYGDKAESPAQPMVVVFFESDDGVKGQDNLGFYKHPSPKTKLFKFVKLYGQLKVGMRIRIQRNENGYWGLAL